MSLQVKASDYFHFGCLLIKENFCLSIHILVQHSYPFQMPVHVSETGLLTQYDSQFLPTCA